MSNGTWTCHRCHTTIEVGFFAKRAKGAPSPSLWVRIFVATFGALQRQKQQPIEPLHFCPICYPKWLREEAVRLGNDDEDFDADHDGAYWIEGAEE